MVAHWCRQLTRHLEAAVAETACAIRYTLVAMAITVGLYILLHVAIIPRAKSDGWNLVLEEFAGDRPTVQVKARKSSDGKIENGISSDGLFTFHFRDDILNRYFARDKINDWKQHQEEEGHRRSLETLPYRRSLLHAAATLVYGNFDHATAETFFPKEPGSSAPNEAITDADYLRVILPYAIDWLNRQLAQIPSSVSPEGRTALAAITKSLMIEHDREETIRHGLSAQVKGLKPVLSFDWMFVDDAWWILEVVFWCTFGVFAKTLIRLITVGRLPAGDPNGYDSTEFLLFIPKAVLAPLLAVVVVSWWATGYSESKINFANLPYLLVFFFSLGFMTESIYGKLADLGKIIVGDSATASAAKLAAAAQQAVYKFRTAPITPNDPAVGPLTTIAQLAAAAKAVSASVFERGLVTRQVQPRTNS